jgi:hypothetical protein
MISLADPEPLQRGIEDLKANGLEAATERHGMFWFLETNVSWEKLASILLNHFQTYYRYEDHGATEIQVTDPDGHVDLDDREDWLDDGSADPS